MQLILFMNFWGRFICVPFLLLNISEFRSSLWSEKGEEISVGRPTYDCVNRYFLYESFFIFAFDYLSSLYRVAQRPLDTRDGFFYVI